MDSVKVVTRRLLGVQFLIGDRVRIKSPCAASLSGLILEVIGPDTTMGAVRLKVIRDPNGAMNANPAPWATIDSLELVE